MQAAGAAYWFGLKISKLLLRVWMHLSRTCSIIHANVRAWIAASRQKALDGCNSVNVNSLVRQKHETNSKGGNRADVSVPIVLELDAKVVPKNIRIGDRVEWGAKAINTEDCQSYQV
jgi:hypothetical protein